MHISSYFPSSKSLSIIISIKFLDTTSFSKEASFTFMFSSPILLLSKLSIYFSQNAYAMIINGIMNYEIIQIQLKFDLNPSSAYVKKELAANVIATTLIIINARLSLIESTYTPANIPSQTMHIPAYLKS